MYTLKIKPIQKWVGIACCFSSFYGCKQAPEQPNVLIIMCDQLTTQVLNSYGSTDGVTTKHIDRLAREGFVFQNATCTMPLSSPSRASIITGKYPHSNGLVNNVFVNEYPTMAPALAHLKEEGITNDDVTTEKILYTKGYNTHHYGKWHLMGDSLDYYTDMYREHYGYPQEVESIFEQVKQLPRDQWMNWYGWSLPVTQSEKFKAASEPLREAWSKAGLSEFILKMGRLEMETSQTFDFRVASKAIERLKNTGDKPFMLTASFNWPHDPNVVNDPYYSMYDPDKIKLPDNFDQRDSLFEKSWSRRIISGLGEDGAREFLRIYYGCVTMIDEQVGRILTALDESGKADNTIVIFLSDHGDMAGRHGMVWKSTEAFYDELTQVPLIIRYPAKIKPGRTSEIVSLADLMPTILELTQTTIPADIQGKSLVPLMAGKPAESIHKYVYSVRLPWSDEHKRVVTSDTKGAFMVRSKEFKYCRFPNKEEILYDLVNDPSELKNLSKDPAFAEKKKEMSQALADWLVETKYTGQ